MPKSKATKFNYKLPPNGTEINGLELNIDQNTHKLCESYSQSSGSTRSVLYLLLIVSVIALIAVFNNNWKYNWTRERIDGCINAIIKNDILLKKDSSALKTDKKLKIPAADILSINVRNENLKKKEEALIRSDVDDNYTIKVSFIGVAIDINDLASISGVTFILLFFVLRFTVAREKNNLKIALNSITERYPKYSEYFNFQEMVKKQYKEDTVRDDEAWEKLVSDLNFIRRRYHYNFYQ